MSVYSFNYLRPKEDKDDDGYSNNDANTATLHSTSDMQSLHFARNMFEKRRYPPRVSPDAMEEFTQSLTYVVEFFAPLIGDGVLSVREREDAAASSYNNNNNNNNNSSSSTDTTWATASESQVHSMTKSILGFVSAWGSAPTTPAAAAPKSEPANQTKDTVPPETSATEPNGECHLQNGSHQENRAAESARTQKVWRMEHYSPTWRVPSPFRLRHFRTTVCVNHVHHWTVDGTVVELRAMLRRLRQQIEAQQQRQRHPDWHLCMDGTAIEGAVRSTKASNTFFSTATASRSDVHVSSNAWQFPERQGYYFGNQHHVLHAHIRRLVQAFTPVLHKHNEKEEEEETEGAAHQSSTAPAPADEANGKKVLGERRSSTARSEMDKSGKQKEEQSHSKQAASASTKTTTTTANERALETSMSFELPPGCASAAATADAATVALPSAATSTPLSRIPSFHTDATDVSLFDGEDTVNTETDSRNCTAGGRSGQQKMEAQEKKEEEKKINTALYEIGKKEVGLSLSISLSVHERESSSGYFSKLSTTVRSVMHDVAGAVGDDRSLFSMPTHFSTDTNILEIVIPFVVVTQGDHAYYRYSEEEKALVPRVGEEVHEEIIKKKEDEALATDELSGRNNNDNYCSVDNAVGIDDPEQLQDVVQFVSEVLHECVHKNKNENGDASHSMFDKWKRKPGYYSKFSANIFHVKNFL